MRVSHDSIQYFFGQVVTGEWEGRYLADCSLETPWSYRWADSALVTDPHLDHEATKGLGHLAVTAEWVATINVSSIGARDKVLVQTLGVAQALYGSIHEACVAEVVEAHDAWLRCNATRESMRLGDRPKAILPLLLKIYTHTHMQSSLAWQLTTVNECEWERDVQMRWPCTILASCNVWWRSWISRGCDS